MQIPLSFHGHTLHERMGILIRVITSSNNIGYGEIAPFPYFQSETFQEALSFCQQYADQSLSIQSLPPCGICSQLGLESAYYMATSQKRAHKHTFAMTALLSGGNTALQQHQCFSHSTFKWKIGVLPIQEEQTIFKQLMHQALPHQRFRLDANGGLSLDQAHSWLKLLKNYPCIDYLEQPLPRGQENTLLQLAKEYSTPIAWDESITSFTRIQQALEKGFQGPFIIKPALLGNLQPFLDWSQNTHLPIIYSSTFETAIGTQFILHLAAHTPKQYPIGLGTLHYFPKDTYAIHPFSETIEYDSSHTFNIAETLWKSQH